MDERPAILQWKVLLGLLAVVIVAVTVGSVLHSTSKPVTYVPVHPPVGGWTGYAPSVQIKVVGGRTPSPQQLQASCVSLRHTPSHPTRTPYIHRADVRRMIRGMC